MDRTISMPSQKTIFQNPLHLPLLAILVIGSQFNFIVIAWLLPAVSQFSLLGDNISELALGRFGFVQTAAFVISGLGTIGLAVIIQKLTVRSKKSLVGSLMIAIYGMGAILSAFFPTDRIDNPADLETLTAAGTIHVIIALVSFLCIVIGMFVLVWAFRKEMRWKLLARLPAGLFPCGAFALIFAQSQGPLGGLMQRLLVTVISSWIILVAYHALRNMARVDER